MPKIDEYTAHIDVSKWENVALLVLDRLKNYDEKFDKLVELQEQSNSIQQSMSNKLSNISIRVLIHDVLAVAFVGLIIYSLVRFL